jgi:hypothetical protein
MPALKPGSAPAAAVRCSWFSSPLRTLMSALYCRPIGVPRFISCEMPRIAKMAVPAVPIMPVNAATDTAPSGISAGPNATIAVDSRPMLLRASVVTFVLFDCSSLSRFWAAVAVVIAATASRAFVVMVILMRLPSSSRADALASSVPALKSARFISR